MPPILFVSFLKSTMNDKSFYYFHTDKVKSFDTKNIVIIGDSFIALELCGWLTTSLDETKNVSVVMRSEIPMTRI